ncbi:MAG: MFS transporter [bacterium]|nr:MFS transporter [bacterium]
MTSLVRNDRKTIFGWAMYDWANSAFAVTLGAIIAPFFADVIVPEGGWNGWSAETLWAAVVSIGSTVLFLMMPVLGAIADFNSARRRFLRNCALGGGVMVLLLPFVPDGTVPWFLVIAITAHIGFVASNVFYDAFLPGLTTDDTVDRVSSKGFAFGYVGGGLYLVLALALLLLSGDDGITGLSDSGAARVAILGSGLWWMGFTLYSLRHLPEVGEESPIPARYRHMRPWRAYTAIGFGRSFTTAKKLVGYPQLLLFVLAFIFYNDGVQTVINISGSYASETLGLEIAEIAIAFLVVQFVAFGGALFFGMLADRIGAKQAILWSLVVWSLISVVANFLPAGEAMPFYLLAVVVGWVMGGVQALSRSLYSTMIPEEASAEFFGFYSVFSKFSAIWGPLVFSIVSHRTGSGRPAVLSIVVFFIIGGILLARVNVAEARESRARWSAG